MSLNVLLLRKSFALVTDRQPRLTRRSYDLLFQRNPSVVPPVALMDHLEDGGWLSSTLPALGARRARGVEAAA